MNAAEAWEVADGIRERVSAEIATEMAFYGGAYGVETVREVEDAWVFRWQSKGFLETEDPFQMQMIGPIVVPKDGSDPWMMGTYADEDEQLHDYENRRGPYRHRDARS